MSKEDYTTIEFNAYSKGYKDAVKDVLPERINLARDLLIGSGCLTHLDESPDGGLSRAAIVRQAFALADEFLKQAKEQDSKP